MSKVRLVLVGGFLGAGKTTLLSRVADRLVGEGKRVGIITNDQAPDLVDTGLLAAADVSVNEVAGGCFCCKFPELEQAAADLVDKLRPDVLLGEPVGSCTDISATVVQPIKWLWGEWATIAPFTVLTDPRRLREAIDGGAAFPDNVLYIFRKQLEEADIIAINKTDLLSADELAELKAKVAAAYPDAALLTMCAASGEGVEAWLDRVLTGEGAGRTIVSVDYDTYAEGEAALGWLNTSVTLLGPATTDWDSLALGLVKDIQARLADAGAEVAHLKILLTTAGGSVVVNLTTSVDEPTVRGTAGGASGEASLIVNARVHVDPETLRSIVEGALEAACVSGVSAATETMVSFRPGYPTPTHRFDRTVEAGGRPADA